MARLDEHSMLVKPLFWKIAGVILAVGVLTTVLTLIIRKVSPPDPPKEQILSLRAAADLCLKSENDGKVAVGLKDTLSKEDMEDTLDKLKVTNCTPCTYPDLFICSSDSSNFKALMSESYRNPNLTLIAN
ncbi:MAG TPA: hypothetical protein VJG85_01090 [Patescibacteria group bacterium]|nr:hypothetical protein [Patescibacteria group bacterium]